MSNQRRSIFSNPSFLPVALSIAIIALPLAVWRDLMAVTDHSLRRQTAALDTVLEEVRHYYSENVIGQLDPEGPTMARHDYHGVSGAIPIPATLSIELGQHISDHGMDLHFRFVSDYPFASREDVALTENEIRALEIFRRDTEEDELFFAEDAHPLDHGITMLTPVRMGEGCVSCHNSHAGSPKTDWKVGDVRGLQSFTVHQPIAGNLMTFKYLLAYMIVAGAVGILFARHQLQLTKRFRALSEELSGNNEFLAGISMKLSRYLSPQIYKSIFSGDKEVEISTERKKLTVFFSDIKDFTETSENLQPEELTGLLNEYFTEMSAIAEKHGATIDKFIGDAIVAFFGDPETKGTAEDARACVAMALEMQDRLEELAAAWHARGIETPFRARIGINTGYCNVGNFGSETRMDYTIIGAEANLAARLESSAPPGGIVMSYETYAHVRDMVEVRERPAERFKGIQRDVIPYEVVRGGSAAETAISRDGTRVTIDLAQIDEDTRARLHALLDGSSG
jgi:class 3 adenylate cyclase